LDCNHKAESLLGYSKKELQDKILESFSENKSPFLIKSALINREIALAKGELFFEWRMRKRNGEIFWCNKSLKRAAVGEKDRLIVVVRDITEQKNLEKELVCAREKAEKANEVKTTFLANMSHEIRNPLTGILGMTYLLSKSSLPSEQKEQVRALQISAEILSKMLKDMLTVAEIEVGERVSLEETWDLRESLEKLKSHFLILAEEKGLDFNFSIDLENLPKVTGDREAVENILAHLLDNALKFSSEGKIELKTSLTDQDSEKLTLRFEVSDTGPGIPKNFQDEIFGQFIQLDSSTTKKYPGTGLGLYIAKKLAKQMGGSIRLKSSSSRGSVFIADIPLLKSSQ
jgi:PAS domain S-box-containing protein